MLFNIFEDNKHNSILKINPELFTIFIGHWRNNQWKELKDHIQDMHQYNVDAYEIGATAGYTIKEVLLSKLTKASIAFLILTAEDEDNEGFMHARENVIHELGLFQDRLGFSKAIMLLEKGVEEFSNIQGIQQLRFSKDNIQEKYGDVISVINREKNLRRQ